MAAWVRPESAAHVPAATGYNTIITSGHPHNIRCALQNVARLVVALHCCLVSAITASCARGTGTRSRREVNIEHSHRRRGGSRAPRVKEAYTHALNCNTQEVRPDSQAPNLVRLQHQSC
jgi:hypothetical protein